MNQMLIPVFVVFLASCTTRYYIVRHAEKATAQHISADVPLSEQGEKRAMALRERLRTAGIQHIFSTNFQRTRATAAPLAELLGISPELYDSQDSTFVSRLKAIKENTLVVGHSNTVDDIVNGLMSNQVMTNLQDAEYGDLFVIKKRGLKFSWDRKKFGRN